MTTLPSTDGRPQVGAFVEGHAAYLERGWRGVLATDMPGRPGTAPTGYTGGANNPNWGTYPDEHMIRTWCETRAQCSLGLRVPDNVLVIDVDCYDGKLGCTTLEWWVDQVGETLPPTWYSTSRQDGSRKLFYRVPRYGPKAWKEPRDGLELLRHDHRWVRVWPSRNPKTGGQERWFDGDDALRELPPRPGDLAELPDAWVDALRSGSRSRPVRDVSRGGLSGVDEREPFDWTAFADDVAPGEQNQLLHDALASLRGGSRAGLGFVAQLLAQRFVDDPASPKGPWTARDVDQVVQSVLRYPNGPSEAALTPELEAFVASIQRGARDASAGQLRELARLDDRRWAEQVLRERDAAELRGDRAKRSARSYADVEQPHAVLADTLAAEVNLLGGPSEAGKSLLARDWAFDVARAGRSVLWVASEGLHDFGRRFTSLDGWDDVADRIYVLDEPVLLTADSEVRWLLREYERERPALVVFDLVYDMGMADDTGFKDVGPVIGALKKISAQWDCATLALGHSGHNGERRFRGSSSWRQRAAVEWHMAGGTLTCEKSKIANKSRLTRTYEVDYPRLRWTSLGEALSTEAARTAAIQRDLELHPDDSTSARARRLAPLLGVSVDWARQLIRGVTK